MRKRLGLLIFAALSVAAMALTAQPASAESTFERILKEKKLRVAIDVANPPFGILDKDGQPDGSDVATARQMAKDLGVTVKDLMRDESLRKKIDKQKYISETVGLPTLNDIVTFRDERFAA